MVARIKTVAFMGMEVIDVDVQVQLASGLPAFTVVGLPDKAVTESRERVRAAIGALGLALPPSRITVNLAPPRLTNQVQHRYAPELRWASTMTSSISMIVSRYPVCMQTGYLAARLAA